MHSFKGLDLVGRVPEKLWTEVHNIVQEAVKPLLFGIFLTSKIDLAQAWYPFGFFINTCIFLSHKWIHVWVCGCCFSPDNTVHSFILTVTPLVQVTIVLVQSLSLAQLLVTPLTAACQVSLSFTVSQSLLKLMSMESVVPSNYLILCHPFSCLQSFPASGSFPMSWLFTSGGQSLGVLELQLQCQSFQWIFRVDFL